MNSSSKAVSPTGNSNRRLSGASPQFPPTNAALSQRKQHMSSYGKPTPKGPSSADAKAAYERTAARLRHIQGHIARTPRGTQLKDKVCIITGAGSLKGIGWDIFLARLTCVGVAESLFHVDAQRRCCMRMKVSVTLSLGALRILRTTTTK